MLKASVGSYLEIIPKKKIQILTTHICSSIKMKYSFGVNVNTDFVSKKIYYTATAAPSDGLCMTLWSTLEASNFFIQLNYEKSWGENDELEH